MIGEPVALNGGQYTAQYELLRSQVTAARCETGRSDVVGQSRGVGLALLLGEGMPGWLKALEAVIRATVTTRASVAASSTVSQHLAGCTSAPAWLSGVPRDDLTTLLASLVLSTRPVERSTPREAYRSCH